MNTAKRHPLRVAIVGAGWAGLTAAVELVTAGARPILFEAGRQLGGRARTSEIDGRSVDNGQHILIGAYRETLRLLRAVGASPEALLHRTPLTLNYPAAGLRLALPRLPAPLHLAAGLLCARGCTLKEKLAASRLALALQKSRYRVAPDRTVAELLDAHGQHGPLRKGLWEALCLAALNTDPQHASAQIFATVLRDSLGGRRADTDLLLPAADLGRLFPEPAADFVRRHGGEIHTGCRVDNLATLLDSNEFDRVILAVAPQHTARLLATQPLTAPLAGLLGQYAYEPIGTLYADYPPDLCLPTPLLGLPGALGHPSGQGIGQWVFDRGALLGTPGRLAFVLSAHGAWDDLDDPALAALLHDELEATLGHRLPRPHWVRSIRERRATFACHPNLPRPTPHTPDPRLWLAGDYVCADYPATLEGAVRSGVAAARALLASHA